MLKTHTGNRIKLWEGVWTCGAWSVAERDIFEKRPGRARQMRRMVAKAKRREQRERRKARRSNGLAYLTVNEIRAFHSLPPIPAFGCDVPIDGAGEFILSTDGLDNLKRVLERRLTTGRGTFTGLPSYGVSLFDPAFRSAREWASATELNHRLTSGGVTLNEDVPPCPDTVEYGADALDLWRRIPKSPVYTIGVDLAHEAPSIVIEAVDNATATIEHLRRKIQVDLLAWSGESAMSPRARVGVRRGTDPEVEAAFRASVAEPHEDGRETEGVNDE